MKICPQCQTTYTDDSLQFCLQDGTPLASRNNSQDWNESETLVSPKYTTNKVNNEWQPPISNFAGDDSQFAVNSASAAPKKARTGLIVALTALVTLIVIGGAVAGFLAYQRNQKVEVAQNANVNSKPVNAANGNQKTNVNASTNASPSPSPTAAPSVKPTLNPKEAEIIKDDVQGALEGWRDSTEARDLDAHLREYADTVDYYNAGKVGSAKVRADREKAFSMYDNMEVNLSNVKITPDEAGEKAIVTFDKEWNFENAEKTSSGKVRQQLTFGKIKGEWLITGEKDLKVYYVNK